VVAQHLLLSTTLAATAHGAHTVLIGSGTHFGDWHSYGSVPPPVWQDPTLLARPDTGRDERDAEDDGKAGPRAYATSKLAVLHLAHAWQARHGDRRYNVFDPGLMPGTGLGRELTGAQLWAWNHVMPAMTFLPGWSTPRRSGEHLAALALGETHGDLAGGYVELGTLRKSSPGSYDLDHQQRLWDVLEELAVRYTTAAAR
jgi:NAD(P)-dependent dehydrogenase (short-subunit alcohol dehydrogenase family)